MAITIDLTLAPMKEVSWPVSSAATRPIFMRHFSRTRRSHSRSTPGCSSGSESLGCEARGVAASLTTRPDRPVRYTEIRALPCPEFIARRTDPWAIGDRVAWGDLPAREFAHVKHLTRLVAALEPITAPSQ